jgi:hypothetical protein
VTPCPLSPRTPFSTLLPNSLNHDTSIHMSIQPNTNHPLTFQQICNIIYWIAEYHKFHSYLVIGLGMFVRCFHDAQWTTHLLSLWLYINHHHESTFPEHICYRTTTVHTRAPGLKSSMTFNIRGFTVMEGLGDCQSLDPIHHTQPRAGHANLTPLHTHFNTYPHRIRIHLGICYTCSNL